MSLSNPFQGRLIAVVGPSGVGKDSVIAGIQTRKPQLYRVKRVITRPAHLGGEDYHPVSEEAFQDMVSSGAFALHWQAHGLHYGLPKTVMKELNDGVDCIANFSRKALLQGKEQFPNFIVLNITATPETLAQRLASRGRENATDIEERLSEAQKPLPAGLNILHLSNDGALENTVDHALHLLAGACAL